MTASLLDHSVGFKTETTFGTAVTVTKHAEWTPGSSIDFDPNIVQGAGIRQSSHFDRTNRRVAVIGRADGSLQFDFLSKGLGMILEAAMGTATSTLVSGTTYQQVFTPTQAASVLPSLTIQEGIVESTGAGPDALTYAGCSVKSFTIECPTGGIITLSVDIDGKSLATATAYATPALPSAGSLFNFGTGSATTAGTLTVPTTTALASVAGGTATNVKSWSLKVDNGLDLDRWVLGSRNQPTVGKRSAQLTLDVEYDATTGTTLRDAYIAQTATPILLQASTAETLSTGVATLQVAIPSAVINSGAIPMPSDDKTIVTSLEFEILDNLTAAQPLYLVVRTADSAL